MRNRQPSDKKRKSFNLAETEINLINQKKKKETRHNKISSNVI
jgi:hypothetical protein